MKSIKQLARENALTDSCIRSRLEKGWTLDEAIKPKYYKRAEDVAERVKQCDDMLEYLGGYEGKTSIIKLRCLRCGNEFERRYEQLLKKKFEGRCGCPECATKEGRARQRHKAKGAETQSAKEKMKAIGFELLEYTGADNRIKVKCLECGEVFEYCSFHNFMTKQKKKRFCPECVRNNRENDVIKRLIQSQKEYLAKQQKAKNDIKHLRNMLSKNHIVQHECANCGELFDGLIRRKFCSAKCARRYEDRQKARTKDTRIKNRKRDSGITLDRLYKRDKGICYICGCTCDYNDYVERDGTFIAGNKYPSIEHVMPIAKGGTDTWGNVRLACRQCNSIKSDRISLQFTLPVAKT